MEGHAGPVHGLDLIPIELVSGYLLVTPILLFLLPNRLCKLVDFFAFSPLAERTFSSAIHNLILWFGLGFAIPRSLFADF